MTVIEQLLPEAKVDAQVFDEIENCVPVARDIDEIERLPAFVLDNVIVCPIELELTA